MLLAYYGWLAIDIEFPLERSFNYERSFIMSKQKGDNHFHSHYD